MTSAPTLTQEQYEVASWAELHPAVMGMVGRGTWTILDLFDNLVWFKGAADWTAWRAFLCALYALPMTDQELAIYQECTGRRLPPTYPAREVWAPTGRRARKSAIAALIAVFEGGFKDYSKYIAPGERPTIPILGKNKEEAQQIHTFAKAILADESLRHLVEGEPLADTISLITGVDLRIRAVSLTAGRSKTIPLGLLDEVAFFAVEGAVPDVEVVRGIRPGMATIPDAKLFGMSSPWGKRGLLYDNFKLYHATSVTSDGRVVYNEAKERAADRDRVLVWKAPTLRMHKTAQLEAEVKIAYQKDPIAASAEYGADFREDTDAFMLERVLEAAIVPGRFVVPPGLQNYFGFCDPSGGSSDSLTLAIAHFQPDQLQGPPSPPSLEVDFDPQPSEELVGPPGKVVLDFVDEWRAPFDPDEVAEKVARVLKGYGLYRVTGDHYGGKWPVAAFRRHQISFFWSKKVKSEIYRDFLPILNSGQAELLDNPTLKAQFLALDRNVARGGRETIDHVPGGHDDVANAVAGACEEAKRVGAKMKQPARPVIPPTTVVEIHKRRIAEALAKTRRAPTEGAHGNPWRRGGIR